jgi:hypothetical protein
MQYLQSIAPGHSAALSFIITAEHRSIVASYDHSQRVEPGRFLVTVGGHQVFHDQNWIGG